MDDAVSLSLLHGDAIVATAVDAVERCDAELKTMSCPWPLVTEDEICQYAEVLRRKLRRKAEAYDKIAEVVRATKRA